MRGARSRAETMHRVACDSADQEDRHTRRRGWHMRCSQPGRDDAQGSMCGTRGRAETVHRVACTALIAGQSNLAVRSLRAELLSCPPEKAANVAKVRSMLAIV
jgi:hypothetical protein